MSVHLAPQRESSRLGVAGHRSRPVAIFTADRRLIMLLANTENCTSTARRSLSRLRRPRAAAEQMRIADCLSALDDQIAAELQRVVARKTHKQGLMQRWFPSPEES